MDKKPEFKHQDQWLKDLPLTKNAVGFSGDELINCQKCSRPNAPNRLNCLYCGEPLPISGEQKSAINPRLRKLENWEKGCNLIISPNGLVYDNAKFFDIANLLQIEVEVARNIVETGKPLPIARCENLIDAENIREKLAKIGVSIKLVSDESLNVETQPRRLRSIEILPDKLELRLFNVEEIHEILLADFVLIVAGIIFERKISATEKHSKKDENKTLQSSETSNDEPIIDIYSRQDNIGYRIFTKGFDFSCLGEKKRLIASENIKLLRENLSDICKNAKTVNDYTKIRHALGQVWETEETKNSKGLKSTSFSKFTLENVTTINNLQQFTKYSRLQLQLL